MIGAEYKKHKAALLNYLQTNDLSLKMTEYVYEPNFKYLVVHRIRTHFKVKTFGYFD